MTSRTSRVTGLCSVCIKVSEVELLTVLDQVDNKTQEIEALRARHLKSDGHLLAENARLKAQLDQANSHVEQLRIESERLRKERDMLSAKKTRRRRKPSRETVKTDLATEAAVEIVDNQAPTALECVPPQQSPSVQCVLETAALQVLSLHAVPPVFAVFLWETQATTFAEEVHTPPLVFTIVLEQWRVDIAVFVPPSGQIEDTRLILESWYLQVYSRVYIEPAFVSGLFESSALVVHPVFYIEPASLSGLLESFSILVHPILRVLPVEATRIYETWAFEIHAYISPDFAEVRCILEYYSQDLVLYIPIAPLLGEQTWDTDHLILMDLVRIPLDQAEQFWDSISFSLVYPVCIDPAFAQQLWDCCGLQLWDIVRIPVGLGEQLWDTFTLQLVFPVCIDPVFAVQFWDCSQLVLQDLVRVETAAAEQIWDCFGFALVLPHPVAPASAEQLWDSTSVQVFASVSPSSAVITALLETHSILVYPSVPIDPKEVLCIFECYHLLLLDLVRVQVYFAETIFETWNLIVEKQISIESVELKAIYEAWSLIILEHVSPQFSEVLCVLETWSFELVKHFPILPQNLTQLFEYFTITVYVAVCTNPLEETVESYEDYFKVTREEFEEYIRLDAQLKSKGDTSTNKKIAMAKLKLEQANKPVESELERVFRKRDRKYEAFEATSGAVIGKEEGEFGTNEVKKFDVEMPVRRSTLPDPNKAVEKFEDARKITTAAGILKPKKELPADADDFQKINHFLGKEDSTISTLDTTAVTDDGSESKKGAATEVEPKKEVKKAAEVIPNKKATTTATKTPGTTAATKTNATPATAKGITDTRTASKTVASPIKAVAAKLLESKDSPAPRKPALDTGIKKPTTAPTAPAKPAPASTTKPSTASPAKTPATAGPKAPAPPAPPKKTVPGAPAPPPRPTGSAQTKRIEDEDLLDGDELLNGFLNETKTSGFEASGIPAPKKPEPVQPPAKPAAAPKKFDLDDDDDFMNEFIADTKEVAAAPQPAKKKVEKTGDDLLDEFLEMEGEEATDPAAEDEVSKFAANFLQGTSGGTRGGSKNQGAPQIPTAALGRLTSRR